MAFKINRWSKKGKVLISVYIATGEKAAQYLSNAYSLAGIPQWCSWPKGKYVCVWSSGSHTPRNEGKILCKDRLHKTNCDIGLIFPAPWDEPEAHSQALQSHGEGQAGGEKEEESTYVNLSDFIKDKLELYLNRHEEKAKSMSNSIKKLLQFEKRATKRRNFGMDAQWGKGNLCSTNIFAMWHAQEI